MKAVMIEKPGKVYLTDAPIPEPGPGFVRIKVKAAAVCSSAILISSKSVIGFKFLQRSLPLSEEA